MLFIEYVRPKDSQLNNAVTETKDMQNKMKADKLF